MAILIGGDILRPGTSRTAAKAAIGTLIRATQISAPVAARGALGAAQVAADNPVLAGVPLGVGLALGALERRPGQA